MNPSIELSNARINAMMRQLHGAGRGALRPAMQEIGALGKTSTQMRFREQRGPDGSPWRRVRRGGQALRLTGRLRNSITYRADDKSVAIGTSVVYARPHQLGVNDPAQPVKGHVRIMRKVFGRDLRFPVAGTVRPFTRHMRLWARPFLGWSDDDIEDIFDVLRRHLERLRDRPR